MEKLHDHNKKTYENICRMYNDGIQRVAVVQPTGSGKSLLMAKLIEDNPNRRFFILSTSHKINDQFKEKLDEEILGRLNFNIYCNMPNMDSETMGHLQPDYILLDEMHRALAREWSKGIRRLLEVYPNAKVLGLSATPIRYLDRCRNVVKELFGGNLACDMSLSQAILDGILPMARYVCGVYSYEKDAESLNKKIQKSYNSPEEKQELLKQVKILKENLDKGNGVSDIFRKYVSGNEKFVVFLKNTTHLRIMKPVIEKWFIDSGFSVRMYEVHSRNVDKDKEFQAFKKDKGNIVKLCLSVNMVAEGIHGDIDGVIMLRETISPNMYFQMIGRAFSCGKKTIPLIFDLVANSQFISDAIDISFPNELRGEIEKRKEECKKEGKGYEVGFDVDEFIVMDEFMDVVSGFKAIEERLKGSWDLYIKALKQYKEREGDCLVPSKHVEIVDGVSLSLGHWCVNTRHTKDNLALEKEKELSELGFVWNYSKFRIENYIKALKQYKEREGNCLVPSNHIEDVAGIKVSLGNWCGTMRQAKRGNGECIFTEEIEEQLNQLGFVWEPFRYRFEKNVKELNDYYMKYGKYPTKSSKEIEIAKLACILESLKKDMRNNNCPNWKKEIIYQYLPDFSFKTKSDKLFYKFIHFIKLYKERYGHTNVNKGDIIDGFDIYSAYIRFRSLYRNGKLSHDKANEIEKLELLSTKNQRLFNKKFIYARQAVNDKIVISNTNQMYKGVNLYTWLKYAVKKRYQNNKLSNEEIIVIERLIGKPFYKFCNYNRNFVRIIDIIENSEIALCKSQKDVIKIMKENFNLNVDNKTISNRVNGKTTTPYKGRYMFYYATDEEVKKYLEDNEAS